MSNVQSGSAEHEVQRIGNWSFSCLELRKELTKK
jgi:hypothetical protein